jgi:phage baseplate assembly protein W
VIAARHPYRLTPTRRLQEVDADRHLADLVRLVLLTSPGERLHHVDFGAGVGPGALFEPLDGGLGAIVEMQAKGSLEAALGDRIEVLAVRVERTAESTLSVAVEYRRPPAVEPTLVEVALND